MMISHIDYLETVFLWIDQLIFRLTFDLRNILRRRMTRKPSRRKINLEFDTSETLCRC